MGNKYSFSAGTAFSIKSPADCTCNTSDTDKIGFVSGMFIALTIVIIGIGLAIYYKALNTLLAKLLIYLFLFASIVLSALMYFDTCKCEKGSEYGKYDGIAYPLIALGFLFVINIMYSVIGAASKPPVFKPPVPVKK
jgi:hypothetical protein